MIVLGIDPGVATIGFGVVRAERQKNTLVQYGVITTPPGIPLSSRLLQISNDMEELIHTFQPDEMAVEELVKKFFIVRIAWVFGVNGKNFIKTMLRIGKERGAATVVDDQIGSPTYTYDLARLLVDMIQTEKYGRYHATNEGLCSWYEFACEIFRQAGMDEVKVTPVPTSGYPASKAKRPMNSRISKEKLTENGFERLPDWKDAVGRYLKEITW